MSGNQSVGDQEIENRFGYHKPQLHDDGLDTARIHAELRRRFSELAKLVDIILPSGRPKRVAFEHLETAAMWSHKAVATQDPLIKED